MFWSDDGSIQRTGGYGFVTEGDHWFTTERRTLVDHWEAAIGSSLIGSSLIGSSLRGDHVGAGDSTPRRMTTRDRQIVSHLTSIKRAPWFRKFPEHGARATTQASLLCLPA